MCVTLSNDVFSNRCGLVFILHFFFRPRCYVHCSSVRTLPEYDKRWGVVLAYLNEQWQMNI